MATFKPTTTIRSTDPAAIQARLVEENARQQGIFMPQSAINKIRAGLPTETSAGILDINRLTDNNANVLGGVGIKNSTFNQQKASPARPVVDVTPPPSSFTGQIPGQITQANLTGPTTMPAGSSTRGLGLSDIFQPGISQAQSEFEQAQSLQQTGIAEQKRKLEEELARITEEQAAIFAPRFESAQRAAQEAEETARRGFSFRGFGRSSRALETEESLDRLAAQQEAAIAAEQSASTRLARASAMGASEAVLKSLGSQVTAARDKVTELQRNLATQQAGLTAAQIEAGQQAESDRLKARANALEAAGLVEDPDTGERVSTLKARAEEMDAQIAAGKQAVAEGGLLLRAGELDLKTKLTEAQIKKLEAETKKILTRSAGIGSGVLPNLGYDPSLIGVYELINLIEDPGEAITAAAKLGYKGDTRSLLSGNHNYQLAKAQAKAANAPAVEEEDISFPLPIIPRQTSVPTGERIDA